MELPIIHLNEGWSPSPLHNWIGIWVCCSCHRPCKVSLTLELLSGYYFCIRWDRVPVGDGGVFVVFLLCCLWLLLPISLTRDDDFACQEIFFLPRSLFSSLCLSWSIKAEKKFFLSPCQCGRFITTETGSWHSTTYSQEPLRRLGKLKAISHGKPISGWQSWSVFYLFSPSSSPSSETCFFNSKSLCWFFFS